MFKDFKKLKSNHQTTFAIIIAFAVISFWRGLWGLFDVYLFPENYVLSLWASIITGLVILIATHYTVRELT